jgi:hypothetical protein
VFLPHPKSLSQGRGTLITGFFTPLLFQEKGLGDEAKNDRRKEPRHQIKNILNKPLNPPKINKCQKYTYFITIMFTKN